MLRPRPGAPRHMPGEPAARGLIICGHGIDGGPGIAEAHAREIFMRGGFAAVRACCLKGTPSLADAIIAMSGLDVILVPYLMADGFTAAKMPGGRTDRRAGGILLAQPVGAHPEVPRLIERRANAACDVQGWVPAETSLVILAHGTDKDENSGTTARVHAAKLDAIGGFFNVAAGFLEEEPYAQAVLTETAPRNCVAVGLFADAGSHGERDAERLMGALGDRGAYAGPIGTDEEMVEIILDAAETAWAKVND